MHTNKHKYKFQSFKGAKVQRCRVAEWQSGRVAEWQSGRENPYEPVTHFAGQVRGFRSSVVGHLSFVIFLLPVACLLQSRLLRSV